MVATNILVLSDPRKRLHPNLQHLSTKFSIHTLAPPEDGRIPEYFESPFPNLAVVDASEQSSWDGLKIAKAFRQVHKAVPIILLTSEGSEDFTLAVLRAGINDYLKDPFGWNELVNSINRCLSQISYTDSLNSSKLPSSGYIAENLVGDSQAIKELRTYIARIADTDSNVLITGETGTGKELVARLIHENSTRRKKPFICVNCAAIPETLLESELFGHERGAFTGAVGTNRGKMELAQGGTILFDEIGDMSLSAQAKILRAIEERTIYRLGGKNGVSLNVRILAATNRDLDLEMIKGQFRQDLYYRLNVARIYLPPTRERREDIPLLLGHYIQDFNQKFRRQVEGFTDEAKDFLFEYSWPGNVRELKNLVEATFINLPSKAISFLDLPPQFRAKTKEYAHVPANERDRILSALLTTNWNRNKAADKLQWSRMTLYRKMLKYKVSNGETSKFNGKMSVTRQFNNDVTSPHSNVSTT